MLRAKIDGNYRSKNGHDVFRYLVSGTPAELAAYKAAVEEDGDFYREDEKGTPLFFTINYSGDVVNLIITTNGNVVADNSDIVKLESMVAQSSGQIQQELAKLAAAKIMSSVFGAIAQPVAVLAQPTPTEL